MSCALDFFYTGRPFPKEAEVTLEDLLQTLELANYLGIQSLSVLSQGEIIRQKLVNPESLQEGRWYAILCRHLQLNFCPV